MTEKSTAKRGRPAKQVANPNYIVKTIILFLQMFMTETLAKRVVSMILIAVGIPNKQITEITGLSDRSIWTLKKAINSGYIDGIFVVRRGSGRVGKTKGFESAIIEELEKNNYHTRQQVADMILEKFGIKISVSAVGKLLKKTVSSG